MTIYFLVPKLIDPACHKASGGIISNLRMIEEISVSQKVVCIPMLYNSVPAELREAKSVIIEFPDTSRHGRLQYTIERYTRYRQRVDEAIGRHGKGVLISTRATIPVAYNVASRLGMPLVIITRAFEDMEQAGLRPRSDTGTVFRWAEGVANSKRIAKAYRAADLIVTNSDYMRHEIKDLFSTESPVSVIYPSMDLPRCKPTVNQLEKIGFINKGVRKGRNLILELTRQLPDKKFLIYGERLEPENSQPIKNVQNMGHQNDRVTMFGSADLFLVPSVWDEPYGRVAAEAIWCGKPVVVSKKGGLPEAAPNELFWEESADPRRWKKKIEWLEDPAHRLDIRNAIEGAQAHIAARDGSLMEELCGKLDEIICSNGHPSSVTVG